MDIDHLSIGDQADKCVLRDEIETLLERILELRQLLCVDTRVNHKQEDRLSVRILPGFREDILDGGKVLHQLSGLALFCDVLSVLGREVVSGHTDRAGPDFESEIDLAVGVQHSLAGLAENGRVLH
jgi:hypothetical protein